MVAQYIEANYDRVSLRLCNQKCYHVYLTRVIVLQHVQYAYPFAQLRDETTITQTARRDSS